MRETYLPSINHRRLYHTDKNLSSYFTSSSWNSLFGCFFPPCHHHQSSISDLFRYTDKSLYDSTGRRIEPRQANEKVQYLKIPTIHRDLFMESTFVQSKANSRQKGLLTVITRNRYSFQIVGLNVISQITNRLSYPQDGPFACFPMGIIF